MNVLKIQAKWWHVVIIILIMILLSWIHIKYLDHVEKELQDEIRNDQLSLKMYQE